MRNTALTLLIAILLTANALACSASYVKGVYNQDKTFGEEKDERRAYASEVEIAGKIAEAYMDNRAPGLAGTVAGDIIKPYLGGTAIVENYEGSIDFENSLTTIVDKALGEYAGRPPEEAHPFNAPRDKNYYIGDAAQHFNHHFLNGIWQAQGKIVPTQTAQNGG